MKFKFHPALLNGYILVVDEPDIAEKIAGWIQKAGYNTKIAYSYGEAIRISEESHPILFVINTTIVHTDVSLKDFQSMLCSEDFMDTPRYGIIEPIIKQKYFGHGNGLDGYSGQYDYLLFKPVDHKLLIEYINRSSRAIYSDDLRGAIHRYEI
ncbi:MAG: hypothetical protein QM758_26270 [Armatimonas sp.]